MVLSLFLTSLISFKKTTIYNVFNIPLYPFSSITLAIEIAVIYYQCYGKIVTETLQAIKNRTNDKHVLHKQHIQFMSVQSRQVIMLLW